MPKAIAINKGVRNNSVLTPGNVNSEIQKEKKV